MDPPTADQRPQEGVLNVRDFSIRGEADAASASPRSDPSGAHRRRRSAPGVEFSRMRAEFTRSPGKLAIRDGVVWGPAMGATIEGQFDYARDEVRLRGTFIPAYALNNILARVPIVGLFIGGGQNEGVFGMTYEVVGPAAGTRPARQSDVDAGARLPPQDLRVPQRRERPQRRPAVFLADAVERLSFRGARRAASPESMTTSRIVSRVKSVVMDPGLTCAWRACPGMTSLHRLQQHVLLAAERQLDDAVGVRSLRVTASSSRR